MHLRIYKDFIIKYEWLLPTLILLAANNIVYCIKKPELDFAYFDYITSIALSALIWGWLYYMASFFQGCITFLYKLFLSVFFALIASLSYSIYLEFGQFISFDMLRFLKRNPEYISSLASLYLKEYWMKNPIKPRVRHLKSDFRLGRNFLKGQVGAAINRYWPRPPET
jgi:hypothetical protein